MNSLNILSARVSPAQTPIPSRTNSFGNALALSSPGELRKTSKEDAVSEKPEVLDEDEAEVEDAAESVPSMDLPLVWQAENPESEASPLLKGRGVDHDPAKASRRSLTPSRVLAIFLESAQWLYKTLAFPGFYLVAWMYDKTGRFDPLRFHAERSSKSGRAQMSSSERMDHQKNDSKTGETPSFSRRQSARLKRVVGGSTSSSGLSESESEKDRSDPDVESDNSSRAPQLRSNLQPESDDSIPARRSIRIKLHNDDALRQRKHRRAQSAATQSNGTGRISSTESAAAALKSPTSPAASLSLTRYPRIPAPPQPLIPARSPSHTFDTTTADSSRKTLILDLDETLIHSMAKGGRMSTGHMVEVKLNTYIGVAGQPGIGPQHPILYYVHKRPHCDDFLRRVCKWYNLVIFTASVQEYADPVIDWLETERKFFCGRYYRQHCTYRHGAFIKDLSSVEPDLSKVMILDNSPLSYMFHQDNAIPIEGWISDPTDNDLLHLVPLLEGLQYVTDVRALLALRGGEDGKHMTT